MNTALVTVAQRMIDEQREYLAPAENMHLLDKTSANHQTNMIAFISRLEKATELHTTGAFDDATLANAVVDFHLDVANEMIVWTQEVELDKYMARKAA